MNKTNITSYLLLIVSKDCGRCLLLSSKIIIIRITKRRLLITVPEFLGVSKSNGGSLYICYNM